MAKVSPLNLLEQHVEKGVLVISGLIFLFVLVHWGLSSPRRIEIISGAGGQVESVSPDEVDENLRRVAAEIRSRHLQAEVEPTTYGNLADQVRRYRRPSLQDYYPGVVLTLPQRWEELPLMDEQEVAVNLDALADALMTPARPRVNVNRVLPQKSELQETWVAHVAAVYPWGQVVDGWQQLLRGTRIQPRIVVLGVEAEVQQRRPDGQWGQARAVQGVMVTQRDSGTTVRDVQDIPQYEGTNAREVREAIDSYARSRMARVMEPEYWPIYWSPGRAWIDWRVNLPETEVSRAFESSAAEATGDRTVTRDRTVYEGMDRGSRAMEFERERYTGADSRFRPAATDGAPSDAPQPTIVPPLSRQIENGNVLIWLHDEGLQSNRLYRYRLRMRVLNPLYTWDQYVEDSAESRQASIYTPFSDWSDEVDVPRDVQFFLTGSLPPQQGGGSAGRVVVTVFRHSRGQVVRQRFTVSPGDAIGRTETVTVVDPVAGGESEIPVDFSTGAVAVDFDFDKQVEVAGMTRNTAEMLYLDELGRLRSRVLLMDRDSETYRDLRSLSDRSESDTGDTESGGPDWPGPGRDTGRDWRDY